MIIRAYSFSFAILLIIFLGFGGCAPNGRTNTTPQPPTNGTFLDQQLPPNSIEHALWSVAKVLHESTKDLNEPELYITVFNGKTGQRGSDARWIETEIYFALEEYLPDMALLMGSEAIAGISASAIQLKVGYFLEQSKVRLQTQAISDPLKGLLLAQKEVQFALPPKYRHTSVTVLDFESDVLTPSQITTYSELYRSILGQQAGISVMTPNLTKQESLPSPKEAGCPGIECSQGFVEVSENSRVLSTRYRKLDDQNYFITASLQNQGERALILSQTVEHNGSPSTLRVALATLASKLVQDLNEKEGGAVAPPEAYKPGKIYITSNPIGAQIILDHEVQPQLTDSLIEGVPSGKHVLTLRKGMTAVSRSIVVPPGGLAKINVLMEQKGRGRSRMGANGGRNSTMGSTGGENGGSGPSGSGEGGSLGRTGNQSQSMSGSSNSGQSSSTSSSSRSRSGRGGRGGRGGGGGGGH